MRVNNGSRSSTKKDPGKRNAKCSYAGRQQSVAEKVGLSGGKGRAERTGLDWTWLDQLRSRARPAAPRPLDAARLEPVADVVARRCRGGTVVLVLLRLSISLLLGGGSRLEALLLLCSGLALAHGPGDVAVAEEEARHRRALAAPPLPVVPAAPGFVGGEVAQLRLGLDSLGLAVRGGAARGRGKRARNLSTNLSRGGDGFQADLLFWDRERGGARLMSSRITRFSSASSSSSSSSGRGTSCTRNTS